MIGFRRKRRNPVNEKKNSMKKILIILSGILFLLVVCFRVRQERSMCLGIPVLKEEELSQLIKQETMVDNIVELQNSLLPYDSSSRTLYISSSLQENTGYQELEGQLKSQILDYDLYFLWEEGFETFSKAVEEGCKFTLYAVDQNGNYGSYGVFFTTLPVLEMHGECIDIDEREREIYEGEMNFWEPENGGSERVIVQNSGIQWHVRGYSSMSFQKKSLRLSLKKENGKKQNLSLAGLSSDDDYILNPMWFDDVKVREKLAIDLWNEMAEEKNSTLKMSGGEYCEVIINGNYEGLRLLQNKIEKKYLKLSSEDILLKGQNVNPSDGRKLEEAYEVIYAEEEEKALEPLRGFFDETDFTTLDLENWIDVQLLILLGNMKDNLNYKNIYYAVQKQNGNQTLSLIPWDTDMSFGIYWIDGSGFSYAPDSVEIIEYRMEYEALKEQYPDLDLRLANRWKELRQEIFSKEHIFEKIDGCRKKVTESASAVRDFYVLGWYAWGEQDTTENLKNYIENRLQILDEHFAVK